jgi:hypothetical protein
MKLHGNACTCPNSRRLLFDPGLWWQPQRPQASQSAPPIAGWRVSAGRVKCLNDCFYISEDSIVAWARNTRAGSERARRDIRRVRSLT